MILLLLYCVMRVSLYNLYKMCHIGSFFFTRKPSGFVKCMEMFHFDQVK